MTVYNMNHMGKSSEKRRNARLHIIRQLVAKHKVVGLQELHAKSVAEAKIFFFKHIRAEVFYEPSLNMAILVDSSWLNQLSPIRDNIKIEHLPIVQGAIHAIRWRSPVGTCYFFNVYRVRIPLEN